MKSVNERGAINVLLIPFMLVLVFFLTTAGFAFWAFASREDYKNNSDQKAAVAAAAAVEEANVAAEKKYQEEAKKPYDKYIGLPAFGNIIVNYPKSWSAYVAHQPKGSAPISGYFHPNVVPTLNDPDETYALRVELVQQSYDTVLTQFNSTLQAGKATASPFKLVKVPSVVGSRIEGQITPRKQGTMVILPLRNMTLKIWTESPDFKADLDAHILPNLSFVP